MRKRVREKEKKERERSEKKFFQDQRTWLAVPAVGINYQMVLLVHA